MKRIAFLAALVAFIGISCSLSKEDKLYRSTIDGKWELTDVSYSGAQGNFTSVLFKDADARCFEGSEWFFRSTNSVGYYNLPQSVDCASGQRDIRWSILNQDGMQQLQFKFVNEKYKDLSEYGFRLDIDYLDDNTMKLRSNVSVEGEPISIIYSFQRANY